MEIEQIKAQLDMKDMVQEVRQVSVASDTAREELTSPQVATNTEGRYRTTQSMKLNRLREDTIVKAARTYAAQAALAWRYDQINNVVLDKYAGALDKAVSFRPFMEQGVILIPSVLESRDDEQLKDSVLTRINASFVVDEEAVIVTSIPTFRDYLVREFSKPTELHPALLPANEDEEILWDKGQQQGWEIGLNQAVEIFTDGFNEMERDLIGRVTYLKLKSLNMIGNAELQVTRAGVTFNGRAMNVGEEIFRIEDIAQYTSMTEWRTAWKIPNPTDDGVVDDE